MTFAANAACPKCHRPPATRYFAGEVERAHLLGPTEPIHTYTCTRPGCGSVYTITALCLQTATPDLDAAERTISLAKLRRAA